MNLRQKRKKIKKFSNKLKTAKNDNQFVSLVALQMWACNGDMTTSVHIVNDSERMAKWVGKVIQTILKDMEED